MVLDLIYCQRLRRLQLDGRSHIMSALGADIFSCFCMNHFLPDPPYLWPNEFKVALISDMGKFGQPVHNSSVYILSSYRQARDTFYRRAQNLPTECNS